MGVMKKPAIAIVYDWVTTEHGGAERVLTELHKLFPKAPLFTLVHSQKRPTWSESWQLQSSFLQNIPMVARFYRFAAPLMPLAIEQFDFSEFDIIISVSSSFAKGVLTLPSQLHICYLLTPARFLYSHSDKYASSHPLLGGFRSYLTRWDQIAAHRPDVIVPISSTVAQRVKDFYQFKCENPLYPPVPKLPIDRQLATPIYNPDNPFYLVVSRLVAYKQIELAIGAVKKLGKNLIIVGTGPEESNLHSLIDPCFDDTNCQISIHSNVTEHELASLYLQAEAVIQPNIEDFGIAVLEGQALGTPSILHKKSGAADLLTDNHAVFFEEESVDCIAAAIQEHETKHYNPRQLINNMKKYDTTSFGQNFLAMLDAQWQVHDNKR